MMDKSMESSAIVDLEAMDGDESDYEVNFADPKYEEKRSRNTHQGEAKGSDGMMGGIQGEVTKGMASYFFQSGTERAKKAFNIYGNIDVLRPYFDVEPHEVRQRLIFSLIPQFPTSGVIKPTADVRQKVHRELYGPLMVVFTLIAILLFQMKMGSHSVQEGTLMGTAFGTCFGYWFNMAGLLWVLCYVCNTHITLLQIFSMLGYALFGHCVVLFLGTIFHTGHDHAMFYLLWAIFGGLSTLKMVSILVSRTAGKSQKLIVCGAVAAFHLLFLLYLHFAYHQIVEDISSALSNDPVMPKMAAAVAGDDDTEIESVVKHGGGELPNKVNEDVKRAIRSAGNMTKSNLTNSHQVAGLVNNNKINMAAAQGTNHIQEPAKMNNATHVKDLKLVVEDNPGVRTMGKAKVLNKLSDIRSARTNGTQLVKDSKILSGIQP